MTPGRGRGTQKFKRGCGRNTRRKKAPRAQRTRESRLRGKAPGPERTRRVNKRGDPTATDTHRAAPRRPGRRTDSPPSARNLDAFSSRRAGPGAPTATAEEPHTRPSGNERPPRGSRRGFLQPSITHHPFARPCPTRGWGRGGGLASRTGTPPEDKPGPDRARAQGRHPPAANSRRERTESRPHRGVGGADNAGGRERPPRLQPEPPFAHAPERANAATHART